MILDDIVARKREKVFGLKSSLSLSELEKAVASAAKTRDFFGAVKDGGKPAIIAEIKKASPSAGVIRSILDVKAIAAAYENEGAAAISVITEEDFFQGRLEYLEEAAEAASLPLLCKDFIFEPIQVLLARAAGGDAILLITAILEQDSLVSLLRLARSLDMDCLVEVHTEDELDRALSADARIIGINNRDLRTFQVSLDTTLGMLSRIPEDRLVVSESGIGSRSQMELLAEAGVDAVLVGTSLMRSADPGQKLKELMGGTRDSADVPG